ncbi:fructosamine kinase family protein [Microbacterium sp. ET2]|uniref:fructosamine kinase family protein n=1 Tax=Microbacterium albipurpureum TaxID=3050384 RepID=UPI00259C6B4F|nr:fructosamine kinase family protein [Microbacterium sp. ET2 (Ac-2212)]WJL95269.1 fructosamine kinase family protein [Microbacterium sp. ET2 (Ac-2212)]
MSPDRRSTFRKDRPGAPDGFFAAEAAGLAWLAEAGGVRTATVVNVDAEAIELERLESVAPDRAVARAFGAALAVTHDAGAPAFGSPPPGITALFIGRRSQPAAAEPSWGAFYARDRVLPFLPAARAAGFLTEDEDDVVRQACAAIAAGAFDDGEGPARLHGDLWHGNVLWSPGEVVLIDPAAHGGHRETDLAMLALFGCPFLDEIIAGYEERRRLAPGWRDRLPLHQLHPLAVHAAGHGRHYGRALTDAARQTLALA